MPEDGRRLKHVACNARFNKLFVSDANILLITKQSVFYIHGSVHRESNLIIVQQDATYSVYYISVGSSTCFEC